MEDQRARRAVCLYFHIPGQVSRSRHRAAQGQPRFAPGPEDIPSTPSALQDYSSSGYTEVFAV